MIFARVLLGYDFSPTDHVVGDYYWGETTTREMGQVCMNYLKEKNPNLYEEIKPFFII